MSDDVYRELQQHLDQLPVGFPPTKSGVEIRILKHIFTPEEAHIATLLKFSWEDWEPLKSIYERTRHLGYTIEELENHLDNMVSKGGIMHGKKGDQKYYGSAMLLVGMYELQVNKLKKEFVMDFHEYLLKEWLMESVKVPIPQLRTIPVGITIDYEVNIANYDDIKNLIDNVAEPIVVVNCVCRQSQNVLGNKCKATSRMEVCLGFGSMAQSYIDAGQGRQINKDEALEILKKNEEDGLVLQPGNSQKADFICSCCSCCCEGLSIIIKNPDLALLVATNHYAEIDPELCKGCESCIDRCHMGAISLEGDISTVAQRRCIGCGNCIIACPSEAIKLLKKDKQKVPPLTGVDLYDDIAEKRAKIKERELKKKERMEKRKKA